MAMIDIRNIEQSEITQIKFADYNFDNTSEHNADQISFVEGSGVFIEVGRDPGNSFVYIQSEQDAHHLIKALQKAIELGWWSK